MSVVRRATPEDAEELIRLRQVMIDSVFATGSVAAAESDTGWHAESLAVVRDKLADPDGDFAAFVIDQPAQPGGPVWSGGPVESGGSRKLAALVVGTLD